MNIVKVCKHHGELIVDKCFVKTERRWGFKQYYSCKQCKMDSENKWRKKDEDHYKKLRDAQKIKHRDKLLASRRLWQKKNKEKLKDQEKIRRDNNIEFFRERGREIQRKWREELNDNYIKTQIIGRSNLVTKDIPKELIPVKRALIQLRRKMKEIKNE